MRSLEFLTSPAAPSKGATISGKRTASDGLGNVESVVVIVVVVAVEVVKARDMEGFLTRVKSEDGA